MNFKIELQNRIDKINNALIKYTPVIDNPQKVIYSAMNYSLSAGGKRLRPVIMLSVCDMLGENEDICMPFAAAMEMIHTYSLIHDDLPALDNDVLRRGKPTNHVKFGEANAILAGDALLNKAFEIVSDYDNINIPCKNILRAINTLALSSGSEGMLGGQIVDILSEGKNINLDELQYIHLLKTGSIIRASAKIGAIIANASEKQIDAIDEFAKNLGIAFQIQDDILDVEGTTDQLGKQTGSDAECNKQTYVALCGLDKSKEYVKEYSSKAISALQIFGDKNKFLIYLTNYLIHRIS